MNLQSRSYVGSNPATRSVSTLSPPIQYVMALVQVHHGVEISDAALVTGLCFLTSNVVEFDIAHCPTYQPPYTVLATYPIASFLTKRSILSMRPRPRFALRRNQNPMRSSSLIVRS